MTNTKTIARQVIEKAMNDSQAAAVIMELLKNIEPYNQDWENESTTWKFADGSTVTVSGIEILEDFAG